MQNDAIFHKNKRREEGRDSCWEDRLEISIRIPYPKDVHLSLLMPHENTQLVRKSPNLQEESV